MSAVASPKRVAGSDDTVTLLRSLYEAADSLTVAVADVLQELDLTKSQAEMLWVLEPSAPPMPMRDLARKLHCDPSNITLMSDKLVAAGLVERRPDPTDGRRRVLALTDRGLRVWKLLIERIQQRSPIFTLSLREQAQLSALLQKSQAKQSLL